MSEGIGRRNYIEMYGSFKASPRTRVLKVDVLQRHNFDFAVLFNVHACESILCKT